MPEKVSDYSRGSLESLANAFENVTNWPPRIFAMQMRNIRDFRDDSSDVSEMMRYAKRPG